MAPGRGRLSSFELLPKEAQGVVSWAAHELAARKRTQTDIYAEFVVKCEALMAEHRGELEFGIPAFASFNRHSIRQARMSHRLDQTREIAAVLAEKHDPQTADQITVLTAEMIKAAVFEATGDYEDELSAKDLKALAEALRAAQTAQNMSTDRRTKEDAKVAARLGEAIDTVAKAKGLTGETAEAIKAQILGVVA